PRPLVPGTATQAAPAPVGAMPGLATPAVPGAMPGQAVPTPPGVIPGTVPQAPPVQFQPGPAVVPPGGPQVLPGPPPGCPAAAACALLAASGTGCVGLDSFLRAAPDAPSAAPASQAVVFWNRNVVLAPDPVNGGERRPGLIGRMYLYAAHGTDLCSVAARGTL